MNTIIGKDTVFTGTLDVKGAVRVDGTVKGKVICTDTVTVGTTGYVEADLEGQIVVVAGKVVGNLTALDKLELQAKSDVEGDLKTKSLVVEQGAIFCGSCKMKGGQNDLGFLPPEKKDKPLNNKEKEKSKFKI
ncbi:MAG: polymer-forming cytoskeletal protein [candidate division Zixibacteria bacterium]|nr:polymer-forming cytoskeletal protein [candidate division Zixibacteria bacterium]